MIGLSGMMPRTAASSTALGLLGRGSLGEGQDFHGGGAGHGAHIDHRSAAAEHIVIEHVEDRTLPAPLGAADLLRALLQFGSKNGQHPSNPLGTEGR